MAIVGGQQEDEELPGAATPQTGGSSGFVGGGAGGGPTTKSAAPTSSGSYTNLSSYLQANQGAGATTGRAAENVVDQAGSKASDAQAAYSAAGTNDVLGAGAAVNVDPNVVSKLKSGGMMPKDAQVSWTGPNSVTDFTGNTAGLQTAAVGATQDVQDKAKAAAGGQAGVSGLLRNAYQQPNYTAGENNLDSFLAGGTPGGQAELSKAGGVAKTAQGGYDQINNSLNDQLTKEKGWVDTTNQAYDRAPFQSAAAVSTPGSTNAAQTQFKMRRPDPNNTPITGTYSHQTQFPTRSPATAAAQQPSSPAVSGPNANNMTPGQYADLGKSTLQTAATGKDPITTGVAGIAQSALPAGVGAPIVNANVNPYEELKKRVSMPSWP